MTINRLGSASVPWIVAAWLGIAASQSAWACKIYWVQPGGIYRANLDGTDAQQIAAVTATDIAIDLANGEINAAASSPQNGVLTWDLDGAGAQTLVSEPHSPNVWVEPSKVDLATGAPMYWTARVSIGGSQYGLVKRMGPSGPEGVLSATPWVGDVAVDLPRGRFYVADSTLRRANLDGSSPVTVVPSYATGLAVDSVNEHLFWSDAHAIRRTNLDGAASIDLLTGLPEPRTLALSQERGKLLWGDGSSQTISWVNLDGTGPTTLFSTTGWPLGVAIDPRDVDLRVEREALTWAPLPATISYDVVRGDLGILRATGGDFAQATTECAAENEQGLSVAANEEPAPDQAVWYLVRGTWLGVTTPGSWNACTTHQAASRDVGINTSGAGCF